MNLPVIFGNLSVFIVCFCNTTFLILIINNYYYKNIKFYFVLVQDVCLSSARVGLEFYNAARDALLLYEAIIPVKVSWKAGAIDHASTSKMYFDVLFDMFFTFLVLQ